jgi:hypothetical protein
MFWSYEIGPGRFKKLWSRTETIRPPILFVRLCRGKLKQGTWNAKQGYLNRTTSHHPIELFGQWMLRTGRRWFVQKIMEEGLQCSSEKHLRISFNVSSGKRKYEIIWRELSSGPVPHARWIARADLLAVCLLTRHHCLSRSIIWVRRGTNILISWVFILTIWNLVHGQLYPCRNICVAKWVYVLQVTEFAVLVSDAYANDLYESEYHASRRQCSWQLHWTISKISATWNTERKVQGSFTCKLQVESRSSLTSNMAGQNGS